MRFFVLIVAATIVTVGAVSAQTDTSDREVYIYRGSPLAQSGISVSSWGSGRAVESSDSTRVLSGSRSIKITTQSLYAGGRIDFAQPVTLFSNGIDPSRYILFAFYFEDQQVIDIGAQNPIYSYEIEPYTVPKASLVRFVFISDDGKSLAVEQPTNPLDPDDNWCRIAVPLVKFKAVGELRQFKLKRLLIFTDTATTLYLGEIKLVTDTTPIKVDPLPSQVVIVYDEVLFPAKATGGVCSLKYSWDYDASNGIQEETTGPVGRYTYIRGGEFTVTLTVSDVDGIKQPVTVTTTVSVND
ncbi:MAG: PKD domain-containing protein [Armatimonadetes bacterium]|nr:PKD domain-containing protein [Armatimonadota bacterium]